MADSFDPTVLRAKAGFDLRPTEERGFLDALGIQEEPVTFFDSFVAGFGSTNTIVQGARAVGNGAPAFEPVEDFNPLNVIFAEGADPGLQQIKNIILEDEDARDAVLTARSPEELEHVSGLIVEKYETLSRAMENQVGGIAGMLVGGIADIGIALPALGQLKALQVGVNTMKQARLLSASRFAMLGGADASLFAIAEQANDPSTDFTDFLQMAGIGAVAGGGIGAAIPPRLAGVHVGKGIIDIDDTGDAMQEAANALSKHPNKPKSLSAAATADADEAAQLQAKQAGPGTISKDAAPIGGDILSPVGRAQTMSAVSQKKLAPKGYTSADEAYDLTNRIITNRATSEQEILGVTRAADAMSINDELIGVFRKQDPVVKTAFKDAQQNLTNVWGMKPTTLFGREVRMPAVRLSEREFNHIVDNYRHAVHHEADLDLIWLGDRLDLTDVEKQRILPMIEKAAAARDQQANEMLEIGLKQGLIDEKDLMTDSQGRRIPYSPQIINMEEAALDRNGLKDMFRMFFNQQPMDEWLVQKGFVEGTEEALPDGTTVIRANKPFHALDPEVRAEAAARWQDEVIAQAETRAQQSADEARKMAGAKQSEAMSIVVSKMADKVRRLRKTREFHASRHKNTLVRLDELDQLRNKQRAQKKRVTHGEEYARLESTAKRHLRLQRQTEEALGTAEEEFQFVVARRRSIAETEKFVNRVARNQPTVKKLQKAAAKAEAKAQRIEQGVETGRVAERFDFEGRLDRMVDEMFDPMAERGAGWVPDGPVGRLLPKQFDISSPEMRYHPLVQRFYNWDFESAYANYERQVMPRMAMHEALGGRTLGEELQKVNKAFNADIKAAQAAGDTEAAALLRKFQDRTTRDLTRIEEKFLGKPDRDSPNARYWATQIKRFNTANMLGSVALTLPGDLIMTDIATGKFGRGLQTLFTSPGMRKALKDLEKQGQNTMRAVLTMSEDARNLDMRQLKFADLDAYHNVRAIGGAGTVYREASKMLDTTTEGMMKAMMTVNLMRPWNLFMRAGNGHLFMQDTLRNMGKFSKLEPKVQAAYRRRGIGEAEAAQLDALFKKHGTVKAGNRTFPNWSAMEKDDPVTMSKYHRLIRAAMRDAIPEGELGQSPLLASTAIGSVWLQFLTFPMMAKQIIGRSGNIRNLKEPLLVGAMMQGLLYAALGDWARHALRGEGDQWLENWNTTEGRSQHIYTAYVRSPMASGLQSPLLEIITKAASGPVNDILTNNGLSPLFPNSGKFKDANVLSVLAGPTGTQIKRMHGLVNTGLGAVEDPDRRASLIQQGIHAAPFASHPAFRILESYHFGDE